MQYHKPSGYKIAIKHTEDQCNQIAEFLRIYGTSDYGLGNILSGVADINHLYRKAFASA